MAGPQEAAPASRPSPGRGGSGSLPDPAPIAPAGDGVFMWPVRVYWEDTDAGGIVFYANYLKFFERARTEWLRSLGIGQATLRDQTGGMFVVSETSVRYLRPARLDDELLVTAELEESGRASMTLRQRALQRPGGAPLAEGTIRIGWIDAATLRPARIPAVMLRALNTR